MSALDIQIGGSHYADRAIQPIEYIHANGLGFIEGNVVKLVTRWRDKGGLEDLNKIKHYVDLLIELEGLGLPEVVGDTDTASEVPAAPAPLVAPEVALAIPALADLPTPTPAPVDAPAPAPAPAAPVVVDAPVDAPVDVPVLTDAVVAEAAPVVDAPVGILGLQAVTGA